MSELLDRIGQVGLDGVIEAVRRVIAEPTADLTLTFIFLAAVTVALLLLVVGLLLVLTPSRKRVVKIRRRPLPGGPAPQSEAAATEELTVIEGWEDESEREPLAMPELSQQPEADVAGEPRRWLPAWALGSATVPLLIVLAGFAGYVATGTDAYCATLCHSTSEAVIAAAEIDHASCVSCHEQPGLWGVVGNVSSRTRMVVRELQGDASDPRATLHPAGCLGCHGDVLDEVTESPAGIRMSHREPVSAGMSCTECHRTVGHTERRSEATMSQCLPCHDAEQASADCETCHVLDPLTQGIASEESTKTLGSGRVVYPTVPIDRRECSGCHDEESECDTCHGLRMPHSEEFIEGDHASAAAFERKELCYRCHEVWECNSCHRNFDAHGLNWKYEHRASAWDAGCTCHQFRSDRDYPICYRCHDR
ncbi:MAG: hypothetical protein QMC79_08700 [Anaerosomatales bacterium]|nr:hypothetical protein [Anaerosomatales bacterium]